MNASSISKLLVREYEVDKSTALELAKSLSEYEPEDRAKALYEILGKLAENKDKMEEICSEDPLEEWDSCVYSEIDDEYKKSIDKSIAKPKAIKGAYKCKVKGCGSDEFYVWQEQRRSADEGATVMRQCAVCGKRGKEN